MKAFENYANKRWYGQMVAADPIYGSHKQTWKAALEWLRDSAGWCCLECVNETIKEELEGCSNRRIK